MKHLPLGGRAAENLHCYRVHGWDLVSERPLPLLRPSVAAEASAVPEIAVVFSAVAEPGAADIVFSRGGVSLLADGTAFIARRRVKILVEAGRRLVVDAAPDLAEAELHTWLFGPAMGVLCLQRGRPPLHASVMEIDGRAVAFAGASGAGKSTLAQAFLRRGHRMLADDQAVVDPGAFTVRPAYPSMKLWRGSDAGETPPDPALRVRAGIDKYHVPLGDTFRDQAAPLAMVLALEPDSSLRRPCFQAVTWQQSAILLQRLIFRPALARALSGAGPILDWALPLARRVPLQILRRPDDVTQLDEICEQVRSMIGAGA